MRPAALVRKRRYVRDATRRHLRLGPRRGGKEWLGGGAGDGFPICTLPIAGRKDRFSRALKGIGQWCRTHRHWPLREQQAALSRKLRGHYAYYGITGNFLALHRFRYEMERLWHKWLGRRSHGR